MAEGDRYRAGIIGLGFIGGADQVSGDALGQRVEDLGGTHLSALAEHGRVDLLAGRSRDSGPREYETGVRLLCSSTQSQLRDLRIDVRIRNDRRKLSV